MALGNQIPDKIILKGVTQKLAQRSAGSGTHVTATVRSGDVTLLGTLEHEHQRRVIVKTVSAVTGVRRVNDQLQVVTKKRN
jgi:osmotically-inducible protein OsmY